MQSVKPPVDAPISAHILLVNEIPNELIAFSNFKPPLLTYFSVFPFISILS